MKLMYMVKFVINTLIIIMGLSCNAMEESMKKPEKNILPRTNSNLILGYQVQKASESKLPQYKKILNAIARVFDPHIAIEDYIEIRGRITAEELEKIFNSIEYTKGDICTLIFDEFFSAVNHPIFYQLDDVTKKKIVLKKQLQKYKEKIKKYKEKIKNKDESINQLAMVVNPINQKFNELIIEKANLEAKVKRLEKQNVSYNNEDEELSIFEEYAPLFFGIGAAAIGLTSFALGLAFPTIKRIILPYIYKIKTS